MFLRATETLDTMDASRTAVVATACVAGAMHSAHPVHGTQRPQRLASMPTACVVRGGCHHAGDILGAQRWLKMKAGTIGKIVGIDWVYPLENRED